MKYYLLLFLVVPKLIAEDCYDLRCFYNRGTTKAHAHDFIGAQADYHKALKIDPHHLWTKDNLQIVEKILATEKDKQSSRQQSGPKGEGGGDQSHQEQKEKEDRKGQSKEFTQNAQKTMEQAQQASQNPKQNSPQESALKAETEVQSGAPAASMAKQKDDVQDKSLMKKEEAFTLTPPTNSLEQQRKEQSLGSLKQDDLQALTKNWIYLDDIQHKRPVTEEEKGW